MKRTRRTTADLIADLEDELGRLKARAERKKAAKDPAIKHIKSAFRSIEAALRLTQDTATAAALEEVRTTLMALLALNGSAPRKRNGTLTPRPRRVETIDPDEVLAVLARRAPARAEEIAKEIGAGPGDLRATLQRLRNEGRIVAEGKARGTRYALPAR